MKPNLYSITLENTMYGYERAKETFLVTACGLSDAAAQARKKYNDPLANIVEWRIV